MGTCKGQKEKSYVRKELCGGRLFGVDWPGGDKTR
jgi:hypothetical protein